MSGVPEVVRRVAAGDPEYLAMAASEAAFWAQPHPLGLESVEKSSVEGPTDFYTNERFTGNKRLHWEETICRWGPFRRGLVLGTSGLVTEARILETNPGLHLTFVDISQGALDRRDRQLGARFPGRVSTLAADLNFAEFDADAYDVVISSSSLHHVTNLEFCASQVNAMLAPGGYFFLNDYVGEKRFRFTDEKKRLYEEIFARDVTRRGGRPGVIWNDESDLSPFCGVRSDELLGVFAEHLDVVDVRVASALSVCMLRSRPEHPPARPSALGPRIVAAIRVRAARRVPGLFKPRISRAFLNELTLVGDVLTEAGVLAPATTFGVYSKRG